MGDTRKKKLKHFIKKAKAKAKSKFKGKTSSKVPLQPVKAIKPETYKDVAAQALASNQAYALRNIDKLSKKMPVLGNQGPISFQTATSQPSSALSAAATSDNAAKSRMNELQVQYRIELDKQNRKEAREDALRVAKEAREDALLADKRRIDAAIEEKRMREAAKERNQKQQEEAANRKLTLEIERVREQERKEDRKLAIEEKLANREITTQKAKLDLIRLEAESRRNEEKFEIDKKRLEEKDIAERAKEQTRLEREEMLFAAQQREKEKNWAAEQEQRQYQRDLEERKRIAAREDRQEQMSHTLEMEKVKQQFRANEKIYSTQADFARTAQQQQQEARMQESKQAAALQAQSLATQSSMMQASQQAQLSQATAMQKAQVQALAEQEAQRREFENQQRLQQQADQARLRAEETAAMNLALEKDRLQKEAQKQREQLDIQQQMAAAQVARERQLRADAEAAAARAVAAPVTAAPAITPVTNPVAGGPPKPPEPPKMNLAALVAEAAGAAGAEEAPKRSKAESAELASQIQAKVAEAAKRRKKKPDEVAAEQAARDAEREAKSLAGAAAREAKRQASAEQQRIKAAMAEAERERQEKLVVDAKLREHELNKLGDKAVINFAISRGIFDDEADAQEGYNADKLKDLYATNFAKLDLAGKESFIQKYASPAPAPVTAPSILSMPQLSQAAPLTQRTAEKSYTLPSESMQNDAIAWHLMEGRKLSPIANVQQRAAAVAQFRDDTYDDMPAGDKVNLVNYYREFLKQEAAKNIEDASMTTAGLDPSQASELIPTSSTRTFTSEGEGEHAWSTESDPQLFSPGSKRSAYATVTKEGPKDEITQYAIPTGISKEQKKLGEGKSKRRKVDSESEVSEDSEDTEEEDEGDVESRGLSDREIDMIVKRKLPAEARKAYVGTYSFDELDSITDLPRNKPSAMVLNLDRSTGPGTHWVSLWIDPRKETRSIEYFDSFGDEPPRRLSEKIQEMARNNFSDLPELLKFKTNGVKRQSVTSPNCGFFAIDFIKQRAEGVPFDKATGYKKQTMVGDGEKLIRRRKHSFGFI